MRCQPIPAILASCLALCRAPTANGQDLHVELAAAELVVAGRVGQPSPEHGASVFPVAVEEVLKGAPVGGIRIVVPARVSLHVQPTAGERALFCLSASPERAARGEWSLRQRAASRIGLGPAGGKQPEPVLELARLLLAAAPGAPGSEVTVRERRAAELVRIVLSDHRVARVEAAAALAASPALLPSIPAERLPALLEKAAAGDDFGYRTLVAGLLCDARASGLLQALVASLRGSESPAPSAPAPSTPWAETVGRIAARLHGDTAPLRLVEALGNALSPRGDPPRGDPDPRDLAARRLLLAALAATGSEAAVQYLARGLAEPELEDAARSALSTSSTRTALEALVAHAKSGGREAAMRTVDALVAQGTRRSKNALAAIAREHPDPEVRKEASQALAR